MKEDFLHYIWRFLKFDCKDLKTTDNQKINIIKQGEYLQLQGPDFFNAKIEIDKQLWAGTVEIHLKSSDWYLHNHQEDSNYQNVILHVVWEDDIPAIDKNGNPIPTLELKNLIDKNLLSNYIKHFDFQSSIPCKKQWNKLNKERITLFQNQLILKRLDLKSNEIKKHLIQDNKHWEEIFLCKIFHYFGSNINGNSFELFIKNIPFQLIQKLKHSIDSIHALLYGFTGLLPENNDDYTKKLRKEYEYIKHLYQLPTVSYPISYFKLRPDNFPTIRISQFAMFIHKNHSLFFELLEIKDLKKYYDFFDICAFDYWEDKYIFGKISPKKSKKKLSINFINSLLINVILPFKYAYYKEKNEKIVDDVLDIYEQLAFENNHVVDNFSADIFAQKNALHSQALLHLYNEYCNKKQCMQCTIGTMLLREKQ